MNKLLSLLILFTLIIAGCQSKNYLTTSKYLKTEGAGFKLTENSLTYLLMFSQIEILPKNTRAYITLENPSPCKPPITLNEIVKLEDFFSYEKKVFIIPSPIFTSAKANELFFVSIWLVHDNKVIGRHNQQVKLDYTEKELLEFGVKASRNCITSQSSSPAKTAGLDLPYGRPLT